MCIALTRQEAVCWTALLFYGEQDDGRPIRQLGRKEKQHADKFKMLTEAAASTGVSPGSVSFTPSASFKGLG